MLVTTSRLIAPTFVGALAAIGALSHLGAGPAPRASLITGDFQALYETRFTDANPLEQVAVGALASLRYAVLSEAYPGAVVGRDGWLFTAEELEVHDGFDAHVEASASRVAEVRNILSARDIRLLAVIVPDKADIYEARLPFPRAEEVRGRLSDFTALLDGYGVEHIDAAGLLSAAMAEDEVFMRDDTHWSPFGARIVAEAVGARLAQMDLTRSEVRTTRMGQADFDGDLLAFTPTGPFRGLVGPEQRRITRFETVVENDGGLFGDAQVDAALVGTSFSAREAFHFEGFLKQALRADILNFAQEGAGPFAPMDRFLRSEELKLTPPKVVIWEIPVRYVSKEMNR